jgi:gliding motility-associated-like protein
MRVLLPLATLWLLGLSQPVHAQCPPPGFPQPGNTCPEAPILCDNLDGYCATVNNNNVVQNFPGCPANVLNNDEWFAFFAGTTSITIQVVPSNCTPSGNMGLQGGIYGQCIGQIMDVQCQCTQNPFNLSSNNFVVGEIYWMVLDGCAGNVCDYQINVLSGSTVGVAPASPGAITGPTVACPNSTTNYAIAPPNAATVYNWTLTPALGTINGDDETISVSWGSTPGTAQLCIQVENLCYSNPDTSCTTITVQPTPTATLSGSGILCADTPDSVLLTVDFTGNPDWELVYTINGNAQPPITVSSTPYTLVITQPGTFGLQSVTSVTGNCPGTVSGTVTIDEITITPAATTTAAICDQSNGAVDLSVQPSGTYTYNWSNGATTEDLNDVPPGTYTVTVTDGNNCTATTSATVDNTVDDPVISSATTPSTCEQSNGSIDITVTGATSPYTYNWSNGATTEDLNDILAGSYTVTVTGANGCSSTATISLTNDNPPISISGNVTANTTCIGGDGSITITIVPANSPTGSYTYTWSNGGTGTTITDLTPGSYTVTVSAGGPCTQTATFTVPDEPNTPNISSTTTPSVCALSNGDIDITVTGGVSPYTYNWSNGATSEDLNDVMSGSYTVTVTGANGCTSTATINLTNDNPPISISPNITANTTCIAGNGSISITVSPNPPPTGSYTYTWSNGGTGTNLTNLTPGSYTVTVDGGGACTQTATFTVPDQPNTPNISPSTTPAHCGLSDGSASISVSGGVPPYTYNWSTGGTGTSIDNVPGGTYSVTVTGANGCTSTTNITVADNPVNFTITPTIIANTSCNSSNGSISITVTPANPPTGGYTYIWSNGNTGTNLTNLAPGSYTVTVSAGGNCTQTATFNVPDQPNNPTLTPNITPALCGLSNGAASISVNGGTQPFTYIWSNGNTTSSISNVPAGSYSVTVTGSNGCTGTASLSIPDNPVNFTIANTITPNTACNGSNGAISITVTPANPPTGGYTYTWSNGNTGTTLTNLAPGSYTVTVSAGGNCTQTATFNVPDNAAPPSLSSSVVPAFCGLPEGSANITLSGGLPPFTYLWSNGMTTEDLNNMVSGTYTITVTGQVGCTAVTTVNIPGNTISFTVLGSATGNNSCTVPNGQITLTVQPTIPPQGPGYSYLWSNGATTPYLFNVAPGTYTVTVSAGGTCTQVSSFTVYDLAFPPQVTAATTAATCGSSNGVANITVTGGVTPYTYNWSNGATSEDLVNIAAGTYEVTVTGGNGCTATAFMTVANNNVALNITGTPAANTSCSANNGGVNISVAPAGSYIYNWSNGATSEDLTDIAAGTYTVTVTAGSTCSSTASFTVANNTSDPQISPDVSAAICGENNGGIDLTVSGATAPYTFLWSNGETTEDLDSLAAGNYEVTVTAANGCTSAESINVQNNSSDFTFEAAASPLSSCVYNNGAVDLTITPAGNYEVLWSNGETTEDLDSLLAGTYSVTITDPNAGGCTAEASYVVADQTSFPATSQSITEAICGLANGSIDLTVTGGATPYTYLWSNGETTEDLNNILSGIYDVIVTGANGCTATSSANVPENSINLAIDGTTAANTSCDVNTGGIDLSVTPAGTYTYSWSNGEITEDLSGIPGGSYSVTVSAGGTCTAEAAFTVATTTIDPAIAQTIDPAICGLSNGNIDLTINDGVAPFIFNWLGGDTTEDLTNIAAGTYQVTVTGANGCEATANLTVPGNNTNFNIAGTPAANTLCTGSNGAIDISVTPAPTLEYSYLWSGGETTEDLSGLPAGTYTVTVTEGNTCTVESSFTVLNDTNAPEVSPAVTSANCGTNSGGIDLTITGGATPYDILWSTGETTEDLPGIPPGDYSVNVTGADGCGTTQDFTVNDIVVNFSLSGSISANTTCGVSNGSISISISPNPAGTTILWSNNDTTAAINGLPGGDYTVTVTNGVTCSAEETFTVPDNSAAPVLGGSTTDILCFGENTGAIDLTVNGGTAPLDIIWTPAVPGNPQNLANLAAGNYSVVVSDAAGCSAAASFTISEPASAVQVACLQVNSASMPGANDGSGSVTIGGGTAPYTVTWSPGGSQGNVAAGVFTINSLTDELYDVTVTDANGCEVICDFEITAITCLTALGTMDGTQQSLCGDGCITANYDDALQFLEPDDTLQFILHTGSGNVIVNPIAVSYQPTFCFDPGLMNYGVTYYISAVAGNDDGTGNVVLNDNCTVISVGTPIVFNGQPIAGIVAPAPIDCQSLQVPLDGSSSIPGSSFNWFTSNGLIIGNTGLPSVTAAAEGDYSLIVTSNGCSDTASVNVTDNTSIILAFIQADPADILDCTIQSVILTGSATGTNNPTYIWVNSDVIVSTENPLVVDWSGIFDLIVLDTATFCADTATIEIIDGEIYPPLFLDPALPLNCIDTSVTLTGGSPAPNVDLTWATINGTDTTIIGTGVSVDVNMPGTYYLIGTDPANSCTNILSEIVNADLAAPSANAGQPFTMDCFEELNYLDGTGSAGTGPVTFSWQTINGVLVSGTNTATPAISGPGTYQLTVANSGNGCTDTDEVTVTSASPVATPLVVQPPCLGDKGSMNLGDVSGGTPPYVFSIDGGETFGSQSIFTKLEAGSYDIVVQDANGCEFESTELIDQPEFFNLELDTYAELELGDSYQINTQVSVPLSEIESVLWTPGAGLSCDTCLNPVATPQTTTLYKITAVTNTGCEDSGTILLLVNKQVSIYVPNAFSPNNDGVNDVLMVFADPGKVVNIKSFLVFSRWGETVFQYFNFLPNDPAYGWDGSHRGEMMNPAVFAWFAEVEFVDGRVELFEGDVTLVR